MGFHISLIMETTRCPQFCDRIKYTVGWCFASERCYRNCGVIQSPKVLKCYRLILCPKHKNTSLPSSNFISRILRSGNYLRICLGHSHSSLSHTTLTIHNECWHACAHLFKFFSRTTGVSISGNCPLLSICIFYLDP